MKQEEEKKMASLSRAELGSWSPGEDRSGDSERSDDEPCENGHRYHPHLHYTLCVIGAYVNVNLYTSQTISIFSKLKSLKNLVCQSEEERRLIHTMSEKRILRKKK